jgi:hypothetical protein
MNKKERRKMAKKSIEKRQAKEQKLEEKEKNVKKACDCEEKMDKAQMPEWAKVLYHQNKAILAELGIEE